MAHTLPTPWNVNYKGAIRVEAAQYGYLQKNNPKAWCLHTPEEPADATPSTPYYFHNTTRLASTHYFVAWTGLVFQMVPENEGAYANTRETGTRFSWETSANLNLQTINIEIEGYAHNITQTMPRGSPQWRSLVMLLADRCKALGFPIERTFGHKQVSPWRSDPGALRLDWLVQDVNKLLEGDDDDMPLSNDDLKKITQIIKDQTDSKRVTVKLKGRPFIWHIDLDGGRLVHDINITAFGKSGSEFKDVIELDPSNKDHREILNLPVLFPKGLAHLEGFFK